jgi:NTE family protein
VLNGKTVGLALSGGGFRATLFGIGSLWRLNELGLLRAVDRVTGVSGGAILLGFLGARWRSLTFDSNGVCMNFVEELVTPLRTFCRRRIDATAVLLGWLSPFHSAGDIVAALYERYLFKGATLRDLPPHPTCILYATNMQTGRNFRLTREFIADWHLGTNAKQNVRLATAVGASAAFPPLFSPVTLRTNPDDWTEPASRHADLRRMQQTIRLADGGVYDNLGVEALIGNCEIVLVSDAGAPFDVKYRLGSNYVSQLGRVRNVLIDQTRALRKRWLLDEMSAGRQAGTYWGISTEIGRYQVGTIVRDSAATARLQMIPTRLTRFNDTDQGQLINWGYALCDAALRRHVLPQTPVASALPLPQYGLDA